MQPESPWEQPGMSLSDRIVAAYRKGMESIESEIKTMEERHRTKVVDALHKKFPQLVYDAITGKHETIVMLTKVPKEEVITNGEFAGGMPGTFAKVLADEMKRIGFRLRHVSNEDGFVDLFVKTEDVVNFAKGK